MDLYSLINAYSCFVVHILLVHMSSSPMAGHQQWPSVVPLTNRMFFSSERVQFYSHTMRKFFDLETYAILHYKVMSLLTVFLSSTSPEKRIEASGAMQRSSDILVRKTSDNTPPKIPKPPGDVTRVKRGGYRLSEAVRWDDRTYKDVRVSAPLTSSASTLVFKR